MDIDEFLDREAAFIEKEPIEETFLKKEKELSKYEEILKKINSCIKRNELWQAEKLYSGLWLKIKEEKFTWRQGLYNALIEINKRLKESLDILHQETRAKINTISALIAKTKMLLKEGKNESALTTYSGIINLYNEIPYLFLREKKTIYINKILPLHRELTEKIEKTFFQTFNSELSKINNLIYSTKIELQKNNIKGAAKFYASCLNYYNTLPDGFFLQKMELSNKILELYKEITIILEIADLKSRLKLGLEKAFLPLKKISAEPIQLRRSTLPETLIPIRTQEKLAHIKVQEKTSHIEELKRLKPTKKPEKPKPTTLKTAKKEDLKEELIKRKIDRALFKLNKGNLRGANEDLKDVLRLDPDNKKAKELLEKTK